MHDPRATSDRTPLDIDAKLRAAKLSAFYRPGTSDERVLNEVLFVSPYRRKKLQFDVEAGEHWLDLGANIGAFALYCKMRGATAECYEPDPGCFALLRQNVPEFLCFPVAITDQPTGDVAFWAAKSPDDHHRYTAYPMKMSPRHSLGVLPNVNGAVLKERRFDGAKIDIEGSEGGLLDAGYLPICNKLVMEYHLWRDPSMAHLRSRLEFLKSKFEIVHYPPEFDRMLASGYTEAQAYYDRLIYCKRWRHP
jgi:FkbM family methyltransferase